MATIRIDVKPRLIEKAIVRAGLDPNDYAQSDRKILEWITGEKKPTMKQLEEFSLKTHTPFGYFFLDDFPCEETPIPVFRKNIHAQSFSLNLFDIIGENKQRQDWLRDYLEENECYPLPFVGLFNMGEPNEIISYIYKMLSLERNWASAFHRQEDAVNHIVAKMEDNGIIVSFSETVSGNTHRPISVDECRGFCLVDKYAPFIFVNSKDSKTAQLFTLIHELIHILIDYSAGFGTERIHKNGSIEEIFCDSIAAKFLIPKDLLSTTYKDLGNDFFKIAKIYKVSPIMVARRLLEEGFITKAEFFSFYRNYKKAPVKQKKQSGGGDFYRTALKRISFLFISHINNAVNSGQLLFRDAFELTGLSGKSFSHLINKELGTK